MVILISFFLLSIIVSFLCSIWEAVLLSVTPAFVERKKVEAPETGKLLEQQKDDIDTPLSAILTLNTIAHTVGAIGVGAQAGVIFGSRYISIFNIEISYESVIATLMTLAILILSEIIPKTLGANNWRSLSGFTAKSLRILTLILKPFVWLAKLVTNLLNRGEKTSVFSRRDFAVMADVVGQSGQIKQEDHTVIKNILAFDELIAEDIMTPRTVALLANEETTITDFYTNKEALNYSRIPIYKESRDSITGMILKDELLIAIIEGQGDKKLKEIRRDIIILSENLTLRTVLDKLNDDRGHIAVVVDGYGAMQGIVSMEDVFETLFGMEIMDETDAVADLRMHAKTRWEERAKKLGISNQEE